MLVGQLVDQLSVALAIKTVRRPVLPSRATPHTCRVEVHSDDLLVGADPLSRRNKHDDKDHPHALYEYQMITKCFGRLVGRFT